MQVVTAEPPVPGVVVHVLVAPVSLGAATPAVPWGTGKSLRTGRAREALGAGGALPGLASASAEDRPVDQDALRSPKRGHDLATAGSIARQPKRRPRECLNDRHRAAETDRTGKRVTRRDARATTQRRSRLKGCPGPASRDHREQRLGSRRPVDPAPCLPRKRARYEFTANAREITTAGLGVSALVDLGPWPEARLETSPAFVSLDQGPTDTRVQCLANGRCVATDGTRAAFALVRAWEEGSGMK